MRYTGKGRITVSLEIEVNIDEQALDLDDAFGEAEVSMRDIWDTFFEGMKETMAFDFGAGYLPTSPRAINYKVKVEVLNIDNSSEQSHDLDIFKDQLMMDGLE